MALQSTLLTDLLNVSKPVLNLIRICLTISTFAFTK